MLVWRSLAFISGSPSRRSASRANAVDNLHLPLLRSKPSGDIEGGEHRIVDVEALGVDVDLVVTDLDKHPERVLQQSVKGMMPNGSLGRRMLKKLKVYTGSEHPHEAQQPQPLEV